MKNKFIKIFCLITAAFFLVSTNAGAVQTTYIIKKETSSSVEQNIETTQAEMMTNSENDVDLDPLVDLSITVEINKIRAFDKIDFLSNPDFYVKIIVNEQEFKSKVWKNTKYIEDANWSITADVPDDKEFVNITIQLWDEDPFFDKKCDISGNTQHTPLSKDVNLYYSLKTGHWMGDDQIENETPKYDVSGYGRLNGCDDNSFDKNERDCGLWFDIYQNDADGDGIPYWAEKNIHNTSPTEDNTGQDHDNDGVPIEWEHKWGHRFHPWTRQHIWIYNSSKWEDHENMDPDNDGLQNTEEYLMSEFGTDPFRRDIFLEIDEMETGPNGEGKLVPSLYRNLLINGYNKNNVVIHVDDHNEDKMKEGQLIPFQSNVSQNSDGIYDLYHKYFLNNGSDLWKEDIYHYGLLLYTYEGCGEAAGCLVPMTHDEQTFHLNSFQISKGTLDIRPISNPFGFIFHGSFTLQGAFNKEYRRAFIFASVIMHEMGHTLGLFGSNILGVDIGPLNMDGNRGDRITLIDHLLWWTLYGSYKSCMSYGYVYSMIDYSHGWNGLNDHDDWSNLDLKQFEQEYSI
ncbi:MAG: hypothetical protein V5A64_01650 [Candidatus Thermoplasmatota archaeon]